MKIMIAGASGGIGQYLTRRFDSEENELYLTYRSSPESVVKTKVAKSIVMKCDFSKNEEVQLLYSKVSDLDVLVNTMGHFENSLICRMDEAQWDRVIESNLKTVFLSCRHAVPKIREDGHVINISSVLGRSGMIGATNYVASKGAVEAFTRSFALECMLSKRVFVNGIALGYFEAGLGVKISDKIKQMAAEKIPLKRFGDPEDIYKLIKYIISSRYLVGQVICLSGGFYL